MSTNATIKKEFEWSSCGGIVEVEFDFSFDQSPDGCTGQMFVDDIYVAKSLTIEGLDGEKAQKNFDNLLESEQDEVYDAIYVWIRKN